MNIEDFEIFKSIPTIETERLILRRIRKSDLEDVFEYSSDPKVSKYLFWNPHESIKFTRVYLASLNKKYKAGQLYDWGIEYRGKMIGTCGFSKIDILSDVGEVGYVLNRGFWGLGLASEAVRAIMEFGFKRLELKEIRAVCLEENVKSLAVMERCGLIHKSLHPSSLFVKGEKRSTYVCFIKKEEYN